jgi:hypothetical protein
LFVTELVKQPGKKRQLNQWAFMEALMEWVAVK